MFPMFAVTKGVLAIAKQCKKIDPIVKQPSSDWHGKGAVGKRKSTSSSVANCTEHSLDAAAQRRRTSSRRHVSTALACLQAECLQSSLRCHQLIERYDKIAIKIVSLPSPSDNGTLKRSQPGGLTPLAANL